MKWSIANLERNRYMTIPFHQDFFGVCAPIREDF